MGGKRHWAEQNVEEVLERKRHVAIIGVRSCLRESRTRGNGTGQKKASNVVLVKSALG
ncbi:hypothetical protein T11_6779 [Trichinella zimbabwensis]|uniref:Uncharacterized protein n=1 Tax=Trichinella zimbabwensis TaxID=268475 RepID=A0A0V1G9B2_9BILA|nr:hypothetical protein T11_6779 [Trichinella zimbabwensis]